jgi:phosphoglycolate phosphatase
MARELSRNPIDLCEHGVLKMTGMGYRLNGIRAVIFDFDGTLAVLNIDFGSMREQVFDLIKEFGVSEERVGQKHALEIIDEVFSILFQEDPKAADAFYRRSHGILQEIEMASAGEGRLFPSIEETLACLRRDGMKVAIVTRNCGEAVRKVFPRIDEFCDVFVPRNSVRNVKPHPEHLTAVLEALHVSAEEALMVGDHPLDIQAGKRMGTKTIGVLTGKSKREDFEEAGADYVLEAAPQINMLLRMERLENTSGG